MKASSVLLLPVIVNRQQCAKIGDLIRKTNMPTAQEEAVNYKISDKTMGNMNFAVVGICHQTTPHNGPALQGHIVLR